MVIMLGNRDVVVGVGLRKTGTTSLLLALRELGWLPCLNVEWGVVGVDEALVSFGVDSVLHQLLRIFSDAVPRLFRTIGLRPEEADDKGKHPTDWESLGVDFSNYSDDSFT